MAFKKVVVKLHNILNDNTGDDPGDALEVYGRFDATRLAFNPGIGELVPLASFNLFDRSGGNPQDIVEGTAFVVENSAELDIFNEEYLQITGNVWDQDDTSPNDQLGSIDIRIPFNSIATGLVQMPVFEESNQRVVVKMSTTVTAQG